MRLVLRVLSIIVLLLLMVIPVHVHDGFESAQLSRFGWLRHGFEPGSVISQTAVVHSRHRALAINVHSGDRPEAASQGNAATKRDEIMES